MIKKKKLGLGDQRERPTIQPMIPWVKTVVRSALQFILDLRFALQFILETLSCLVGRSGLGFGV